MTDILIIFLFLILVFIVVARGKIRCKSVIFLTISAFWVLMFFSAYILKDGKYDLIRLFVFSDNIYALLRKSSYYLSKDVLIRCLNFGIAVFYISIINIPKELNCHFKFTKLKKVLCAIVLLEFIIFDPITQKLLYYILYPQIMSAKSYYDVFQPTVQIITMLINIFAVLLTFYELVKISIESFKIPVLRIRILLLNCAIIILVSFFISLFREYPHFLIRFSQIADFVNYESISISYDYQFYFVISIIFFVCIVVATVFFAYYFNFQFRALQKDNAINKKLENSYLGVKTMAHYMKNEILNLSAEIEDISKSDGIDAGTQKRLEIAVEECNNLYGHLNKAHNYFNAKKIKLELVGFEFWENIFKDIKEQKLKECNNVIINVNVEKNNVSNLVDRFYMTQALNNIIGNSIEAFSKQNKKENCINISVNHLANYLAIEIKDNAIGIPKEDLKRIFDPYYSSKSVTTNWGVGLSLTYKIIKIHNGEIHVSSKQGSGTDFTIILPICESKG